MSWTEKGCGAARFGGAAAARVKVRARVRGTGDLFQGGAQ
jgi:hypothetical protein